MNYYYRMIRRSNDRNTNIGYRIHLDNGNYSTTATATASLVMFSCALMRAPFTLTTLGAHRPRWPA